jgi:hypothetical protein
VRIFGPDSILYNTSGVFFCPSVTPTKASEGLAPFVAAPTFLRASFSRRCSAASLEMSGSEGARPRPRLVSRGVGADSEMPRPQEKNARFFKPERVSSLFKRTGASPSFPQRLQRLSVSSLSLGSSFIEAERPSVGAHRRALVERLEHNTNRARLSSEFVKGY